MKAVYCAVALAGLATASIGTAKEKRAASDPVALGRQLFDYNCSSCHGRGIGNPGQPFRPGTASLAVKYGKEKPALLEERTDLTPDLVTYFVRNGTSIMAPYRKTEISDAQLAALGGYLSRNNPDLKKSKK